MTCTHSKTQHVCLAGSACRQQHQATPKTLGFLKSCSLTRSPSKGSEPQVNPGNAFEIVGQLLWVTCRVLVPSCAYHIQCCGTLLWDKGYNAMCIWHSCRVERHTSQEVLILWAGGGRREAGDEGHVRQLPHVTLLRLLCCVAQQGCTQSGAACLHMLTCLLLTRQCLPIINCHPCVCCAVAVPFHM